ncbi:MAG: HD domain-containing protein [Bacteroidales bacterium]|nr:HD domain-containing protein [Bacteroidales bacterium]
MATLNKKKIINDPVYGFINIVNDDLFDLIQTSEIQRLRRIKQLGLSNLVYPGAEHTRFAHSLGAMHLMNEALEVLRQKGVEISQEEYTSALSAILLHDSGHSPFSHCLEHVFFSCPHEEISFEFMKKNALSSTALEIFSNSYPRKFLHQLVSSQVDTDRLDYLTRDSFFTGVSEGIIGTERILKMFNVQNDELVIDQKGIYSIEKFIISRRLMYWQVYMHKTVVAADNLLEKVLLRARDLQREGKLFFEQSPLSEHLFFFLNNGSQPKENKEALDHFLLLDDSDVWSAVKVWSKHQDKILSSLASNLINRKLGKIIIQDTPFTENQIKNICKYSSEEEIRYFTNSDELHNKAYNFKDTKINILFKDGSLKEICDASDQLDSSFLSKEIKKYFYYQI